MQKNAPVGLSNFGTLINRDYNYVFVDKSLFIKEVLDDFSHVTLITRPRRWGKTMNLSMLEYFLSNETHSLYLPSPTERQRNMRELKIAQIDDGRYLSHLGQYPVIFISLKDLKEQSFELAIHRMRDLVRNLFDRHASVLLDSSHLMQHQKDRFRDYLSGNVEQVEIEGSLLLLSRLLFEHYKGKKVYILIDEYDTPLNTAYLMGYVDKMAMFMKNFFSAALKDNIHLHKGIMTGILRVSKDSLLSGLNNIEVHSVVHNAYTTHFGFNDDEVTMLFKTSGLNHDLTAIREYYNGYRMGGLPLYNPWSIIECLRNNGELQPYWVQTSDDRLLTDTLLQAPPIVKQQLQSMISDDEQPISHIIDTYIADTIQFEDLKQSETALWSLLLSAGYLTVVDQTRRPFSRHSQYRLTIPNQEVRSVYTDIFKKWLCETLTLPTHKLFIKDLIAGRVEAFTLKLEQYLLTHCSYHDFTTESNYHTFLMGLLCSLVDDYFLYSNAEAGEGRADIVLVPRCADTQSQAIIFELKRDRNIKPTRKNAQKALDQIDRLRYQAFTAQHPAVQKILKIGLIFNGKQVASAYRLDEV